jgi:hypothetical protein
VVSHPRLAAIVVNEKLDGVGMGRLGHLSDDVDRGEDRIRRSGPVDRSAPSLGASGVRAVDVVEFTELDHI